MATRAPASNIAVCKELTGQDGPLCKLIHSPLYNLFPFSPVFESNFTQVTKQGKSVSITNVPTHVTLGVTSSEPSLSVPNVLLMAKSKWASSRGYSGTARKPVLELTRMLPLQHVQMSVHDARQRILCVRVTDKAFYLQLNQHHPRFIFNHWCRLVDILNQGLTTTTEDPAIQHSLASSDSPSRSISSLECAKNQSFLTRVSKKMSGIFSQISGNRPKKEEKQKRRMSFQTEAEEDIFNLTINLRINFCDMPTEQMCPWTVGPLSVSPLRRNSIDLVVTNSDSDLLD